MIIYLLLLRISVLGLLGFFFSLFANTVAVSSVVLY